MLPFSCPFGATKSRNGGKCRHKAKVDNQRVHRVMARDPATIRAQRTARLGAAFSAY
jgi:hypothetical protein